MRVGVISDVHSNLPALLAVLESIDAAAPEEIWCLGDVVGYGAQPDECTELVRERCVVSLNGNHDLAVTGAIDAASFSETARAAVDWTRANASAGTVEFLAGLAPEGDREGFGLFHASPRDPIWEYVLSIDQAEAGLDAQRQRMGLVGHSHVSLFFTRPPSTGRKSFATGAQTTDGDLIDFAEGEWLLNPGSVGQPRDGDPRAAWLELDTDESTARYHRVAYDTVAAGATILEAGLPTALAERLQIGR
ncbi:MAG TPA: metallophosphoesterase family protein [Solirubrobacterales bacterium]|nr:metallophosphoesterase family protein [Solirubrobacterales bacterium]